MRRSTAVAALAVLTLAACSKPAANGPGGQPAGAPGAGGSAPAAATGPTILTGGDVPHFKAGQWEVSMTMGPNDHDPADMKICQGDSSVMMAQAAQHCSKMVFTRTGLQTVTVDTACAVGTISSTTHAVMTGDFSSAFTTDSDTQVTGSSAGVKAMHMHKTYRYLGPCPAGQTPGDME